MNIAEVHSYQPLLAHTGSLTRFRGTYFLFGFKARIGSQGKPYWEMDLADSSGEIKIYCCDRKHFCSGLRPNSFVQVEVVQKNHGDETFMRCVLCEQWPAEMECELTPLQLPRILCPVPDALDQLLDYRERIKIQNLRRFFDQVVMQSGVNLKFITCPASLNFHHNFSGGLLQHSVETAWAISGVQAFDRFEKDLAIIAALLHDIGKTQTMTADLTRTSLGNLVDHDSLTLELCSKALAEMDLLSPGFGNQLRHAWTCASPGSRYGFKAQTLLAEMLRECDSESATSCQASA